MTPATVEKFVESGELVFDLNQRYGKDFMSPVEQIINIMAKDSAMDTIKRLPRPRKEAITCVRRSKESMSNFTVRFVLPAKSNLNLANGDRSSQESQNLAMVLLANADLLQKMFSSGIEILVTTTKCEDAQGNARVPIARQMIDDIMTILTKIHPTNGDGNSLDETDLKLATEFKNILTAANQR